MNNEDVAKVEIVYEDGSRRRLEGAAAKEWGRTVSSHGVIAALRGIKTPTFPWIEDHVSADSPAGPPKA
jgi:hypothetical protein